MPDMLIIGRAAKGEGPMGSMKEKMMGGEGESESSPKVDAARLVRKAMESKNDTKLADALTTFLECCKDGEGEDMEDED